MSVAATLSDVEQISADQAQDSGFDPLADVHSSGFPRRNLIAKPYSAGRIFLMI